MASQAPARFTSMPKWDVHRFFIVGGVVFSQSSLATALTSIRWLMSGCHAARLSRSVFAQRSPISGVDVVKASPTPGKHPHGILVKHAPGTSYSITSRIARDVISGGSVTGMTLLE